MGKVILIFLLIFSLSLSRLPAQSSGSIISDLQAIHIYIKSASCANQQLISNRSMNLFLSDKIGSYLTDYKSLSFYKNYVTLNTGDGTFSLNHNLFQPTGIDKPVRSFYVVGVKANVANALVSAFTGKAATNELGLTLKKTWIARPGTRLNNCFDKNVMDTKRESILLLLEQELKKRDEAFNNSVSLIQQGSMSDSTFIKTKEELCQNFYMNLRDEFSQKFASLQYQELTETAHYRRIATHWTNFTVYLPIVLQRFVSAESFLQLSENKKAYPFELSLNHTRFWEIKKTGRLFLDAEIGIYLTNSMQTHTVESISYEQYKNSGGIDTLSLRQRKINTIYIGNFQTFLTPAARFKLVYYPPDSHIGLSAALEQNIGTYRALNWTLGIPIVLINKAGAPSSNFEFQLKYFDVAHIVLTNRTFRDNISISMTIGVPFSKIIY